VQELNEVTSQREVDERGNVVRHGKNAGGWPLGRIQKNLRLPINGCANEMVEIGRQWQEADEGGRECRGDGRVGEDRDSVNIQYIGSNKDIR
jgi:hypothetical protein